MRTLSTHACARAAPDCYDLLIPRACHALVDIELDSRSPTYGSTDGLVSPALLLPCIRLAPFAAPRVYVFGIRTNLALDLDLGIRTNLALDLDLDLERSHHQWQ